MNRTERQMVALLSEGRSEHGYVGVKAEFEAEGTRVDELLRLVEITRHARLKLAVKIGGCEAIRDMLEAKQIGVDYIIAPMVESPYALEKYVAAKNQIYSADELCDTQFLFNLETITGYENRRRLIELAAAPGGADGIVFGRGDFCRSIGMEREGVNHPRVTQAATEVGRLCKENGLDLVVGGRVTGESIDALRCTREIHLTRFETRKVVFEAQALDRASLDRGLLNAFEFELLWLLNKRDYYGSIAREDARRIDMLESRLRPLKVAVAD